MSVVTRFAPSPTGDLHLGHAYAARFAHDVARRAGGGYLVRIEDIDRTRCRQEFEARNLEDLAWLGLAPDEMPLRQSARLPLYRAALDRLIALGVTYPCLCTRARIRSEIAAAAGAPQAQAPAGTEPAVAADVYPGTCRRLDPELVAKRIAGGEPYALRLHGAKALRIAGAIDWTDAVYGRKPVSLADLGDAVIARKDLATSYHLAVVVDDAAQGITHVTRGEDLLQATPLHRLLYALLGLPPPLWHHHPLCRDGAGRRLAKRSGDLSVHALRTRGYAPEEVMAMAECAARGDAQRSSGER